MGLSLDFKSLMRRPYFLRCGYCDIFVSAIAGAFFSKPKIRRNSVIFIIILKISLYDTGVTAQFGDQFLTLSTCTYHVEDGRFVVVAKETGCEEQYAVP